MDSVLFEPAGLVFILQYQVTSEGTLTRCLMHCSRAANYIGSALFSGEFAWSLVQQAKVQDEICLHICKLDKKETFFSESESESLSAVWQAGVWLSRLWLCQT